MDARSSSSSGVEPSFRSFLERSLAAIREEVPELHGALRRALERTVVRLCVDDERMLLRTGTERLLVADDGPGATVEFAAGSGALLELTSGSCSFLEAARSERIHVLGGVRELLRFYDALVLYLQGTVRSPSLPWLLDEFERSRRGAIDEAVDRKAAI